MSTYNELNSQYSKLISDGQSSITSAPEGTDTTSIKQSLIDTYNKKNALDNTFKKTQQLDSSVTGDTDMDTYGSNIVDAMLNEKANASSITSLTTNLQSSTPSILSSGITDISVIGHRTNRTNKMKNQSDRRIKLRPKSGVSSFISNSILMSPLATTNGLIFPFTPRITIMHQANYGTQQVTHANQDFKYYTNTPAQSFNISGEFTAQTQEEARYMLGVFHFISTLTKMHSGGKTNDSGLGLPPPVLLLSGLGPYVFNDLPVILTNGSYTYEPTIDMVEVIVNNVSNDVPSLCTVTLDVTVQNTPEKLRTFNWESFANGKLLADGGWK